TVDLSTSMMTHTRTFRYPTTPLLALPRYDRLAEDWANNDTGTTQYTSFSMIDWGSYIETIVQYPDNSFFDQKFTRDVIGGQPQWDDGLVYYESTSSGSSGGWYYRQLTWEVDTVHQLNYNTPRIQTVLEVHEGTYSYLKWTHFDYYNQYNEIAAIIERTGVGARQRLRSTRFSYFELGTRYIWSLPAKVEVFDPNPDGTDTDGPRVSFTAYRYDEYTAPHPPLMLITDATHHDDAGYDTRRGNATSVLTSIDPTCDPTVPGCNAVEEDCEYDGTGNLRSKTLGVQ